ncbi:phage integrase N-terminal domain-containing protein [Xenorhabdus cabanillasii]|uniref:phage integrase N-terminal domain-containing protein n=1 Tax=Xenorhabdus cabanillasii TaxID=351673 RepID=UPI002B4094FA|nr:phage integrase N-terminal domain-containing protein [Xenorhabdus sp. Flor]
MHSTDTPQYLNTRSLWRTDIRQGGGSHKTCHDRIRIAGRLGALLLNLNIQVKSLSHLKNQACETLR